LYRRRQSVNGDSQVRQWYVDQAKELHWVRDIDVVGVDELPIEEIRGFIVRHGLRSQSALDHDFTIVLANGLDHFTERFVTIKETMHCFFQAGDGTATDSEIILDAHLRQFFGNSASTQSAHVQAEYTALWMAMGVLCPERARYSYRKQYEAGELTLDQISKNLQAPPHIVRRFLSDQYEDEIRDILN
jgi:hypothetical protein